MDRVNDDDSFHIVLPSNVTSFPDNKIGNYTTTLPAPLMFDDDWLVGLRHVSCTYSWNNIKATDYVTLWLLPSKGLTRSASNNVERRPPMGNILPPPIEPDEEAELEIPPEIQAEIDRRRNKSSNASGEFLAKESSLVLTETALTTRKAPQGAPLGEDLYLTPGRYAEGLQIIREIETRINEVDDDNIDTYPMVKWETSSGKIIIINGSAKDGRVITVKFSEELAGMLGVEEPKQLAAGLVSAFAVGSRLRTPQALDTDPSPSKRHKRGASLLVYPRAEESDSTVYSKDEAYKRAKQKLYDYSIRFHFLAGDQFLINRTLEAAVTQAKRNNAETQISVTQAMSAIKYAEENPGSGRLTGIAMPQILYRELTAPTKVMTVGEAVAEAASMIYNHNVAGTADPTAQVELRTRFQHQIEQMSYDRSKKGAILLTGLALINNHIIQKASSIFNTSNLREVDVPFVDASLTRYEPPAWIERQKALQQETSTAPEENTPTPKVNSPAPDITPARVLPTPQPIGPTPPPLPPPNPQPIAPPPDIQAQLELIKAEKEKLLLAEEQATTRRRLLEEERIAEQEKLRVIEQEASQARKLLEEETKQQRDARIRLDEEAAKQRQKADTDARQQRLKDEEEFRKRRQKEDEDARQLRQKQEREAQERKQREQQEESRRVTAMQRETASNLQQQKEAQARQLQLENEAAAAERERLLAATQQEIRTATAAAELARQKLLQDTEAQVAQRAAEMKKLQATNMAEVSKLADQTQRALDNIDTIRGPLVLASGGKGGYIGSRPVDFYRGIHNIMVYCDIVDFITIGNFRAQLLQTLEIPSTAKAGDQLVKRYDVPDYIPVHSRFIPSIQIALRDDSGQDIPFEFGRVMLKLHFKRRNRNRYYNT